MLPALTLVTVVQMEQVEVMEQELEGVPAWVSPLTAAVVTAALEALPGAGEARVVVVAQAAPWRSATRACATAAQAATAAAAKSESGRGEKRQQTADSTQQTE